MKRTLPRQRIARSPLIQVLAQAMFAGPVFSVRDRLGTIQTELNALGLTRTYQDTETEIGFSSSGEPQPPQTRLRWTFMREDQRGAVVLTEQLVVLHTSEYDTFDTFVALWEKVARVVFDATGVQALQRIGLRYTDRVVLEAGEQFEQYVAPTLRGFPPEQESMLRAQRLFARSDTVLQTSAGTLSLRYLEGLGLSLPPDLRPSALIYKPDPPRDAKVFLLDLDHFRHAEMPARVDSLMQDFWELHDSLDIAFRTLIQPDALRAWGQEIFQ